MQDYERQRVLEWLRSNRGHKSQDELARDITARTGWTITRDRYSRYESGSLPFGRDVLGHFIDYWRAMGVEPPDFTPPTPQLSLEERAVLAAERSADAQERYAAAVEVHVRLLARQVIATEAIALQRGATLPTGLELTRQEEALFQAYGVPFLVGRMSEPPRPDPLPAGEG